MKNNLTEDQIKLIKDSLKNLNKISEVYGQHIKKTLEVVSSFPKFKIPVIEFPQINDFCKRLSEFGQIPNIDLSQFKVSLRHIDNFREIHKDLLRSFENINKSNLSQIRANVALLSSNIDLVRELPKFQNTFAVQIADALINSVETKQEDDSEYIQDFRNIVESVVSNESNAENRLKKLKFIFLIISLLFDGGSFMFSGGQFYYSRLQYEDSQKNSQIEDYRFSKYIEVLQQISNKIENAKKSNDVNYVAKRRTELKVKSNFNSHTLATIYPNQELKLISMKHKWIYVEYFDYLDGIPKYGWANKKYLVKIEKSK